MKLLIYNWLPVIFICTLATCVYLFKLNDIPNGFYVDEASVAYNAWSILETGKDEYGFRFPLLFRLFDSYTPPLFIYAAVPLVALLGMEPFTFRVISAIAALTSIPFFYAFVDRLGIFRSPLTKYVVTFFYALSPLLVFYARIGYEITLAFAVCNIGLFFLLKGLKNRSSLITGITLMSLSMYIAHTQRYIVPLWLLVFLTTYRKLIFDKRNKKALLIASLVSAVIHIPHLYLIFTPAFWIKGTQIAGQSLSTVISNYFHQVTLYYSPKALFFELPDIDLQHTIPQISVLYDWMVIPYLIGFYFLFQNTTKLNYRFILLLFITATIPAALSGKFISIQRALPLLFPLVIIIGIGIDVLIRKLPPKIIVVIFTIFALYSGTMLYRSYFVLFPKERAQAWNYGYVQLAQYIEDNPRESFVIDNARNPRLYIELLYHLRYSPSVYQNEIGPYIRNNYYKAPPILTSHTFGNVESRYIDWGSDAKEGRIIIGDAISVSQEQIDRHGLEKIYEIKDPLGKVVFVGYKTN